MRYKPIVIVAAFLFSVSSQAGSHGIPHTVMGDSASTSNIKPIKMLSQQISSSGTIDVYVSNSPTLVRSSSESSNRVTDDINSHDAVEHESVVFLAQGMSGFITF
ncbi:hypothetical protein IH181_001806 [Salmonella enterica subsp. enterica serovar Napoli]|uniref:Uncharacterized protein n=1 Tax=Salmonella enterica subsp. enterica serovar Napoli TaxID=1151001 RepID=A0A5I0FCJ5_SALET|nr:hypothetical protein [Salmonella enterica]EAA4072578.1 hypothetical protein [Salmonella enterica subsp. enterica serovar Napoli]EBS1106883.1 hypothetical protein [Salmonella enterica subsp. enterica serovar Eingedi]ECF7023452.1 hypothetical protein [Salmonella enterica subsp. enterica]ECY8074031.1 hypothetical protein [Salmonella enterica subsp. enterica serovar Vitkin]EDL6287960.1 hypothetical protein [Salmonella enterica subsp. enterica serovar Kottbus]EDQ2742142.1 hypothetical protein [